MSVMEQERGEVLSSLKRLDELDERVAVERRVWEIKMRDIDHAAGMIANARARLLLRLSELEGLRPVAGVRVEVVQDEGQAHPLLASVVARLRAVARSDARR